MSPNTARKPVAEPTQAAQAAAPASLSLWQAAGRRLVRKPAAVISMLYILALIIVALFADQIAPYSYELQNYEVLRANPLTPGHLLGTDALGRDIFSRMIYGTRVSMSVGFVVLSVGVTLGITLGAVAGFYGGWIDMVISRITDMMFAFPDTLLAILIMGIRGPGITNLFVALGVVGWPSMARLVRGQILALKEREFVQAAQSLGSNDNRIILRHLVPNILSPVLVQATLSLGQVVMAESALSFLGIGIRPPYPSWGSMLSEMVTLIYSQPQLLVGPSLILALTVLAFNFLGDGLRDALDPRLKH